MSSSTRKSLYAFNSLIFYERKKTPYGSYEENPYENVESAKVMDTCKSLL